VRLRGTHKTVLSPVWMTAPVVLPLTQRVPCNPIFLVSRKLGSVFSVAPVIGKLSPVSIDRSALKSDDTETNRTSAGIFCPSRMSTWKIGRAQGLFQQWKLKSTEQVTYNVTKHQVLSSDLLLDAITKDLNTRREHAGDRRHNPTSGIV
jgi:hypothetical protein